MPMPDLNIVHADLGRATEATRQLLDELLLDAYLFEVEPRDGVWNVKIEFATSEGAWQTLTIAAPPDLLLASLQHADAHEELLRQWSERLCNGKRAPAKSSAKIFAPSGNLPQT
jgi:hypothetical protein